MASCGGCEVRLAGMSNIELLPAFVGSPVACTRVDRERSERAQDFRSLFAWLLSSERVEAGFRWVFQNGPGVERQVRELARREHRCCPFLAFVVSTRGDEVVWETRAAAGAEDVVEAFYAFPETLKDGQRETFSAAWH